MLKPILEKELAHLQGPGLIKRPRKLTTRVTCSGYIFCPSQIEPNLYCYADRCATELFAQCWQCPACGWEVCHDCVLSMSVSKSLSSHIVILPQPKQLPKPTCSHCPTALCRATHFDRAEVNRAVKHMRFLLQGTKQ